MPKGLSGITRGYLSYVSSNAGQTMEEGKYGVDSVAQMCNFILELYCVKRGGGGRERL